MLVLRLVVVVVVVPVPVVPVVPVVVVVVVVPVLPFVVVPVPFVVVVVVAKRVSAASSSLVRFDSIRSSVCFAVSAAFAFACATRPSVLLPACNMSAASTSRHVTVRTGPNIAVVKYWGKRDAGPLNLACNASISLTMDNTDICAQTSVAASSDFTEDRLWLNGKEEKITGRISGVLAQVRSRCQDAALASQKIHVVSRNSFPTAAGLASSAAGYAALTVAVAALLGVKDSYPGELTTIARMGSGSACRSLEGGLVKWNLGEKADGTDSTATQHAPEQHWPLDMTILVANAAKKHTSSTSGMQNSIKTSALMEHRVAHCVEDRIERLTKAFLARDFDTFGRITMQDSNQFHVSLT